MRHGKILIVEDEILVADGIKRSLGKHGYKVASLAVSGEKALQIAEKENPDLVLMDIVLKGDLDGINTADQIHKQLGIPVIFLTAYCDNEIFQSAKITEPFGYITKPFDTKQLILNIEMALYKSKMEKEKEKIIQALQEEIIKHKIAEEKLKKTQVELSSLAGHLQTVREKERTFIAREIHDDVGQILTTIKMEIASLEQNIPDEQKSQIKEIQSLYKLTDRALITLKRLSRKLRPLILDDLGLIPAIEYEVKEFQDRSGINCELSFSPKNIKLDDNLSTAIFRIFQESLTNIYRHARATNIKISLKKKKDVIEMKISDNGIGINEEDVQSSNSLGLLGIRERTLYLQGDLLIIGNRDKGTTITVTFPCKEKDSDDKNNYSG